MRFGALVVVLATGCQPYAPSFTGEDVWKMFPFDGERQWDYISTDTELPHKLIATCDGVAEIIKGKNVYTVQYATECVALSDTCVDGELQYQLRWSSDSTDGTFLYAYALGEDAFTEFDEPIKITNDVQKRDEAYTTTALGATWTSTMLATEQCPIHMAAEWSECAHWLVETDSGDGFPIAGDYWTVAGNGIAAFQHAPDTGQWQLSDFECVGDNVPCDGDW